MTLTVITLSLLVILILGYLSVNMMFIDAADYKYYRPYYKSLPNRKFIFNESSQEAYSLDNDIYKIWFDLDSKLIETDKFTLSQQFPDCLDIYQLFWWFKFWHYFTKHIEPTLNK